MCVIHERRNEHVLSVLVRLTFRALCDRFETRRFVSRISGMCLIV